MSESYRGHRILFIILVLFFGAGCVLLIWKAPVFKKVCSKVIAVGGCDKFGECGARFESGHVARAYYPVVGAESCFKVRESD